MIPHMDPTGPSILPIAAPNAAPPAPPTVLAAPRTIIFPHLFPKLSHEISPLYSL